MAATSLGSRTRAVRTFSPQSSNRSDSNLRADDTFRTPSEHSAGAEGFKSKAQMEHLLDFSHLIDCIISCTRACPLSTSKTAMPPKTVCARAAYRLHMPAK